jgi:XTP/dITP diphosphohydrolase
MRLLLATRSQPKLVEVQQILGVVEGLGNVTWLSPDDLGFPVHPDEDGIEVFQTFEENAAAKAIWFASRCGIPAVADDSGLEVDVLGGAPGVWSRRFCPERLRRPGEGEAEANNRHLLELLAGAEREKRGARFVCVAALAFPDSDEVSVVRGAVEGEILEKPVGRGGFGYDPLFRTLPGGVFFGEASREEKAALSHRGQAFRQMAPILSGHADRLIGGTRE